MEQGEIASIMYTSQQSLWRNSGHGMCERQYRMAELDFLFVPDSHSGRGVLQQLLISFAQGPRAKFLLYPYYGELRTCNPLLIDRC